MVECLSSITIHQKRIKRSGEEERGMEAQGGTGQGGGRGIELATSEGMTS